MVAIEGFTALRRRGLEVGGVLFGEPRGGDLHIEAFEQTPCEHRYGPSFTLSEEDREKLGASLEEQRVAGFRAVGFYRSFTGRDPVIEEADEAFVRKNFPQGDFVYLMLQPLCVERCVASYRLFRDGELLPGAPEPPFAFDPRQMPEIGPVEEREPEHTPLPPPLPPPYRNREEAPASVPADIPGWAAEPSPGRRRWLIPALACLAIGAVGGAIYQWGVPPRAPQAAQPKMATDTVRPVEIPKAIPSQTGEADRAAPPPASVPKPDLRVAAPPAAVHEVQPRVPEGIRSRITGPIVIPVAVEVNQQGRVLRAKAEAQTGDGVHRYLADLAQKAAREWRFSPARNRSGNPVAAGKTIRFVFIPDRR
jgi:hypothetical protein